MKRLIMLSVVVMICLFTIPVSAGQGVAEPEAVKAEAVRAFEQILDLWRAGNYGGLYDRTLINGKDSRESFSKRMATAQLNSNRPAAGRRCRMSS